MVCKEYVGVKMNRYTVWHTFCLMALMNVLRTIQSPVEMGSMFTVAGLVELVEEMEEEVREPRESQHSRFALNY
jgi:hypothetical protein